MILAGLFGLISALFMENDILLSNAFNLISSCLFFFEAISVFRRRKSQAAILNEATVMRRALFFGDFCFVLATILDIIVSAPFVKSSSLPSLPNSSHTNFVSFPPQLEKLAFMYLLDSTVDWDESIMILGIAAAVLWVLVSLVYVNEFMYEVVWVRKMSTSTTTATERMRSQFTENPPPPQPMLETPSSEHFPGTKLEEDIQTSSKGSYSPSKFMTKLSGMSSDHSDEMDVMEIDGTRTHSQ